MSGTPAETLPPGASPMDLALEEARLAAQRAEVPVGAVVMERASRRIVARAGNETEARRDPTAHAEILAIRQAAETLGRSRLVGCDLYVTLEPCAMCAGAIALARLDRLYFGAADPKGGAVLHGVRLFDRPTCHHRPDIYDGLGERESAALLRQFFADRR